MRRISAFTAAGVSMMIFLISLIYAGDIIIHTKINIVGATVRDLQGEVFGKIVELEHDNVTGDILFAILMPDEGAGFGGRMIPVPIGVLQFRNNSDGVINISIEKLASAPSFENGKRPDMSDRKWSEDTYRFYGIRPYWEQ